MQIGLSVSQSALLLNKVKLSFFTLLFHKKVVPLQRFSK